jgi:hypothetical protein
MNDGLSLKEINAKFLVVLEGECSEDEEEDTKAINKALKKLQDKYVVHQVVNLEVEYGVWTITVLVNKRDT